MILKIIVSVLALGTLSTAYMLKINPYSSYLYRRQLFFNQDELNLEKENKEYGENSNSNWKPQKRYTASDMKLNWTEAYERCQDFGMVLATPVNTNELLDLINYITSNDDLIPKDQYSGYWIGGRRKDNAWKWESINQNNIVTPLGWLPGEPNYYSGEDCIELKKDYFIGFNNYYCNEKKRFICEQTSSLNERNKNNAGKENNIDNNYKESDKETVSKNDELNDPDSSVEQLLRMMDKIKTIKPEEELDQDNLYYDYEPDISSWADDSDEIVEEEVPSAINEESSRLQPVDSDPEDNITPSLIKVIHGEGNNGESVFVNHALGGSMEDNSDEIIFQVAYQSDEDNENFNSDYY